MKDEDAKYTEYILKSSILLCGVGTHCVLLLLLHAMLALLASPPIPLFRSSGYAILATLKEQDSGHTSVSYQVWHPRKSNRNERAYFLNSFLKFLLLSQQTISVLFQANLKLFVTIRRMVNFLSPSLLPLL